MACEPPVERDVPLSRWSSAELAAQAVTEGLVEAVSASTVRRWLHEDAIKPWQHRSWIFLRDPDFAVKAALVFELYQRLWCGVELGADEYVISADEKSQLQALSRRHPEQPPGHGRTRRVEFEYRRHGTLAYFGAYDVHRARLMGRVEPKTGIAPFGALVEQVMSSEPYASARRVFWAAGVLDRGQRLLPRRSALYRADAPGVAHRAAGAQGVEVGEVIGLGAVRACLSAILARSVSTAALRLVGQTRESIGRSTDVVMRPPAPPPTPGCACRAPHCPTRPTPCSVNSDSGSPGRAI